jgi:hypothetical protein
MILEDQPAKAAEDLVEDMALQHKDKMDKQIQVEVKAEMGQVMADLV